MNFVTEKDFSWVETWSAADAPDRQIRRLMERDNKKARENARKDYTDTVKASCCLSQSVFKGLAK